jgi:hypothetical protein
VQKVLHRTLVKMAVGNVRKSTSMLLLINHADSPIQIYFITAIAIIGGGLFGFDISSLSAIIGTDQCKSL